MSEMTVGRAEAALSIGMDVTHQLLREIADRLDRPPQTIPWEHVLWSAEEVGAYLKVSARTVLESYAAVPGFPRAARPGGSHPRYFANEIVEWVASSRPRNRK